MTTYDTNPSKRCVYCEGREVITHHDDGSIETSLVTNTIGQLMCRDRDECRQNVDAENTIVSYYGDEQKINKKVVTKYGRIVSEIEIKEVDL